MKSIDKIPTSKIQRASKILQTGAKIGVNYLKYYGARITESKEDSRAQLDKDNASDLYNGLNNLKGSALKVAQMMSMEKNILPQAYVEKFSLAQFSVPPLSAPLVKKTFKRYFDKDPSELYDTFNYDAKNAASIGQVHQAQKNGKELAVKVQYPGISDSISSDLAMVKPIAMRILKIKGKEADRYFKEVEEKLMEETDYVLELAQSVAVSEACKHIPNLLFPKYYSKLSNDKVLTMGWMNGKHLSTFSKENTSEEKANQVGQALWDFYMYQIHVLKKVNADPHPGNFLVSEDSQLIAIDFGCMKFIPEDFYIPYFELTKKEVLNDPAAFKTQLMALEILKEDDTPEDTEFYTSIFKELLTLFSLPYQNEKFDFSNPEFFDEIAALAERYAKDDMIGKMDANRGSVHFIYINRMFFGLYSLMNSLQAKDILIENYKKYVQS